jgi:metal-dependent amidase/aminoacylase/carboxypeptidase family protein
VTESFGASYEFKYGKGYPPGVNHEGMMDLLLAASEELFGEKRWEQVKPSMGGEDFAYYSLAVPSVFFRLGVHNGEEATGYTLHHPLFDLDEAALPYGAALLSAVALRCLTELPVAQVSIG